MVEADSEILLHLAFSESCRPVRSICDLLPGVTSSSGRSFVSTLAELDIDKNDAAVLIARDHKVFSVLTKGEFKFL